MSVQDDVINFLLTLNLTAAAQRETLVNHAGLDQELLNSIDYAGAPYPFVTGLVSAAKRYGQLANGQDAVVAVLLAARNQVGLQGRERCDGLIREWLSSRPTAAHSPRAYHGAAPQVDQPGIPPFQAPRILPDFVGREDEIERLVSLVQPGARAAITGITGMGGLGKTELAKVAAARAAGRFADGVLWADCGKQDLATIADLWAGAWGVQLPGDDEVGKAAAWRALVSGREALLVFDDVQPGQVVEPLFPPAGQSAVLITTRDGHHPALRGAESLALEQFTEREAMDLARTVLGKERAEAQAGEAGRFFGLVGHLPLAVSVGLHLARECGWDLATLNGRLASGGALAVLGDEGNLRKSLNATFEAAWQSLGEELRATLATLALFNAGPSFDTAAAAAVLAVDEAEAGGRLARLAGRSLLTRAGEGQVLVATEGRWALHELLRTFAAEKERMRRAPDAGSWLHKLLRAFAAGKPLPDEEARARMAEHYAQVLRAADELYMKGGEGVLQGLGLFDLEWPHIRAGQAWAAAQWRASDRAARLCSDYPDAGVYCLGLRLGARDRVKWLEAAAGAARRLKNRAAEGAHLGNLGLAYAALGEARRAVEYHEQALAISREIGVRRAEGADLGNLGNAYAALGEARRAVEYYEQALAIAREIGDRRGEGNHSWNLGLLLEESDPARAAELMAVLVAYEAEIGHPDAEADGRRVAEVRARAGKGSEG